MGDAAHKNIATQQYEALGVWHIRRRNTAIQAVCRVTSALPYSISSRALFNRVDSDSSLSVPLSLRRFSST